MNIPFPEHLMTGTLGPALLAGLAFGLAGITLMVLGFKIFDWLTPGNMQKEILEKGNIAAAILAAGFLVAVAIIVAAAFS